ncbi:hypothetical protein [Sphingomonas sp. KC8]|uniref:hypothetical protein n=1 Tax=Sphingomonas sp. KC8 TaxID=1030157 RepID=UPI000248A43A|nr:hypothetical protein [Sphingomonas sp. KC8]ARS27609.1 hypothetical protein KC8_09925 [Sphingomonas sp. KC8]
MSLRACLPDLVAQGKVNRDQAAEMGELFDELERVYARQFGAQTAAAMASEETIARLATEKALKRRQAVLQIAAQKRIVMEAGGYTRADGTVDLNRGLLALIDRDPHGQASYSNVEARRKSIVGQAHSGLDKLFQRHRRNLVGNVMNPADLDNAVRAAFGEAVEDVAAREIAMAWAGTAEGLRQRFNAAGGAIGKLENWGLPQSHDSLAVRKAGYQAWRNAILPRLDPERMTDNLTGKAFTPERLELALRDVWETIATDGWSSRSAGGIGGSKLANARADHRFLIFKSADDWLAYNDAFGGANPFDAMMGHIEGMARDIAALEILGPNPTATLRWMQDLAQKEGARIDAAGTARSYRLVDGEADRARQTVHRIQELWDGYSGAANAPVNGKVARGFSTLRSVLVSAQLGSAAVSAISDLGFQKVAARMAGLPYNGVLGNYMKLFTPTMNDDQRLAIRLGLIADGASQMAAAQMRYVGEVQGREIAKRLSDGVLRASLLSPWTQAGKWAFGMQFFGTLADHVGVNWAALPDELRGTMARYGIGADGWEIARAAPLYEHKGAKFLRPDDVDNPAIATKLLEMVQTETSFAVPEASLRARSYFSGGQPGTVGGEFMRSVMMYKNFGVTLMMTHAMRALGQKTMGSKAAYVANLVIATTLLGGLAMQAKDVAKGKDPRPIGSVDFWGAALLQGGGMGVAGDFLFSDVNRFGGGLPVTLAGPVASFVDDTRRLTLGNALQLPGDEPTNFGRELTRFVGKYTPGSSIWYSRLAFQRVLLDQLQYELDPDAAKAFSRLEDRAWKDFGQNYYWAPGELTPDRAPAIEALAQGG